MLYGGDSSERDVSIETGSAIAEALERCGHRVQRVDVRSRAPEQFDRLHCDLAFIALHGAFGEDGQLQRLLEERGIPYTGSAPAASDLAMDKPAAKKRFIAHGIPTPDYAVVERTSGEAERRAAVARIGLPQIIKPDREGSSVGLATADTTDQALTGLEQSFQHGDRALIEQFITGRELTVGILGDRALPIVELRYPGRTFNNKAKYTPGVTQHIIDPRLPHGVAERVRTVALNAHRALGCRDISRVDLIINGDHTPYVLEVNTIPGMTQLSLVPDAAQAAGIGFDALCQTIAEHALRRAEGAHQPTQEEQD